MSTEKKLRTHLLIPKGWRKQEGAHRITLEMPESLWRGLQEMAHAEGAAPVQLIRLWIADHVGTGSTEP